MIISPRRNFIFLHSPKTAGSSVSLSLAQNMLPDDVMIGCWADAHKHHIPYNAFAMSIASRNRFACAFSSLKNLIKTGNFTPKGGFVNRKVKAYFREKYGFFADAHTPAEIVRNFNPELWDKAFKFAFVRNPWTHAVSNYKWCTKKLSRHNSVSFKEFLLRLEDPQRPDPENIRPVIITNWDIYTIKDCVCVDYIGRYETLSEDLKKISRKLGFEVSVEDISAKSGVRSKKKCIDSYYDEEDIERVRRIYKKEIDAFSYDVPF